MLRMIVFLSLASLATLAGCRTVNDAPITTLYVIDVQHQVCSVRKITDKNTLASVWVEDRPLWTCDGSVGLSMQEYLNLRTYMKGNK